MQTLIANISGTDSDTDKRKTALLRTTPPALGKNNLMNFGPLTARSALLLAAILCLCVCVWLSVHGVTDTAIQWVELLAATLPFRPNLPITPHRHLD